MKKTILGAGAVALGVAFGAPASAQNKGIEHYFDEVQEIAAGELQGWITDPIFVYAIREQNEMFGTLSERRIARLDKQWIAENGKGPMIGDLLDRQASIILRDRRELSKGVITEIILMDKYGLNVAISDPTSDFYQGDEAKYQDTFLKGARAVHVSEVEYDESTGVDQTQVSMTVIDPENGAPIGAVTFGINLEVLEKLAQ
ncbi:MAG: PDC sensor domain-containing protein [Pseudomonadota bacterium]